MKRKYALAAALVGALVLPLCSPEAVCTAEGGGHQTPEREGGPAQPTQTSRVGGTCSPRPTDLGSWDV